MRAWTGCCERLSHGILMNHPSSLPRRALLRGAAGVMLAGSLPILAACNRTPSLTVHGTDITGADFAQDFSLKAAEGGVRTLADFRGKLVMIFFGFTQCPDVCPTALVRASEIKRLLGPDGDALQVIFITIDPARDTPEVLAGYTAAFDPSFLGLYGDQATTDKTVKDFRMYARKVETGNSYTMDHTSLSYLYDTNGKLRVLLRHEQSAQECVEDIRQVMANT